MTDPCRKFLTDAGFKDPEVESIVNDLPNAESLPEFIKEINTKTEANKTLNISRKVSERRSKEAIKAIKDGLTDTSDPFKTLWNF